MFKIYTVGLMRNRSFVVSEIEVYFSHLKNPGGGSGFQSQTINGRMMSGEMGCQRPGPFVPKGIEMSDPEYLRSINRMDCALVALKTYDLLHHTTLWDYIHARYRHGLKSSEIEEMFNKTRMTLSRWNNDALLLIANKIC